MNFVAKVTFLAFIVFCMVFSSCIKEDKFSEIPHIEYTGFGIYESVELDSIRSSIGVLAVSYTDGDGNIGFFKGVDSARNNYFIDLLHMKNGHLEILLDHAHKDSFSGRLPVLSARRKSIKGEINLLMNLSPGKQDLASDTIAFNVFVVDRAGNKSNVLETPLLIIDRDRL